MHFTLRSVLLACLFLIPTADGQVCDSCKPGEAVELCVQHQGIEEEAIRSQQQELESEEVEVRVAALELIAATTAQHTNVPTERVAQVLVDQLSAPDPQVQARAAELLIEGQHTPTVLPALMARLALLDPDMARIMEKVEKLIEKSEKLSPQGGDPNLALKNFKQSIEVSQELVALAIELHSKRRMRVALGEGLGNLRDDRATQALLDSLAQQEGASYSGGSMRRALLQHGTLYALRGVSASLRMREKELTGIRKEYEKAKDQKLPKQPGFWKGTKSQWTVRARKERQSSTEAVAKRLDVYETLATECLDDLEEFGAKHGFSKPPGRSQKFASSWKRWVDKNSTQLPKAVGTLPGT